MFDAFPLRYKFAAFALLFAVTVAVPTALYWSEATHRIDAAKWEKAGVTPVTQALRLIQLVQRHRGVAGLVVGGKTEWADHLRGIATEIGSAIAVLEREGMADLENARIQATWREIKQNSVGLLAQVDQRLLDSSQSFAAHSRLISQQLSLLDQLVDYFGLSLDPEGDGYFLMNATLAQTPHLLETLGQQRGLGVRLLSQGYASDTDRTKMFGLIEVARSLEAAVDANFAKAFDFSKRAQIAIEERAVAARGKSQSVIGLAKREVVEPAALTFAPDDYYLKFTDAMDARFELNEIALGILQETLDDRVADLNGRLYALSGFILALFATIGFFGYGFIRNLLRQLGGEPAYAIEVVRQIAAGKRDESIAVGTDPSSLLANMQIMQLRLRENDQLKSDFVSTVSHELRTPLTAINGAIGLLLGGKIAVVPPQAAHLLELAQRNGSRLALLVDDLLDMEKLAAGKMELALESLPIMVVVEQAIAVNEIYANELQVKIMPPQQVCTGRVLVDPVRIQQVLANLISNAVKFSEPGGQVEIDVTQMQGFVRVDVIDHGHGIPEAFKPKIFQKFAQADSSDTKRKGGTGLGLSISKDLVERMNGSVGFESTEGKGARFYFLLPLCEPPG